MGTLRIVCILTNTDGGRNMNVVSRLEFTEDDIEEIAILEYTTDKTDKHQLSIDPNYAIKWLNERGVDVDYAEGNAEINSELVLHVCKEFYEDEDLAEIEISIM